MSVDTHEHELALQQVVTAKAPWRKHALAMTWEEKVATNEQMWTRDAELMKVRERLADQKRVVTSD